MSRDEKVLDHASEALISLQRLKDEAEQAEMWKSVEFIDFLIADIENSLDSYDRYAISIKQGREAEARTEMIHKIVVTHEAMRQRAEAME